MWNAVAAGSNEASSDEDREGAALLRGILDGIDVVTWGDGVATVLLSVSIEQFERLCLWESSQEDCECGESFGDGNEPDSQYEVEVD